MANDNPINNLFVDNSKQKKDDQELDELMSKYVTGGASNKKAQEEVKQDSSIYSSMFKDDQPKKEENKETKTPSNTTQNSVETHDEHKESEQEQRRKSAEEKEQRNIARLKEAIDQKGIFNVAKETLKQVMEEYPAYDMEGFQEAKLHEPKDKEKAEKLAKHGTLSVLSKYLNVFDHTMEEDYLIRELSKKYNISPKQETAKQEQKESPNRSRVRPKEETKEEK
jgi:hypothetical protein